MKDPILKDLIFYKNNTISTSYIFGKGFHLRKLLNEAYKTLLIKNAGGQSEISEAISFDTIIRIFGCKYDNCHFILLPEMKVPYKNNRGKILDGIINIYYNGTKKLKKRIAISVTRAMMNTYRKTPLTYSTAKSLLIKKVDGLVAALDNSMFSCKNSILFVCCDRFVNSLYIQKVWNDLDFTKKYPHITLMTQVYPDGHLVDNCVFTNNFNS